MLEGYADGMLASNSPKVEQWIAALNSFLDTLPDMEDEPREYIVADDKVQVRIAGRFGEFRVSDLGRWSPQSTLSELK